jgi:LPS sulfotransferase NodH
MRTRLSCLVAATPDSGDEALGEAMTDSGVLGAPRPWFRPYEVPVRAEELAVPADGDFAASYLRAVRTAGTGANGVFAAILQWTDLRWLIHVARMVPSVSPARLDAEAVAELFPTPRYVLLSRGDRTPDEDRWRAYFRRYRIAPLELSHDDLVADPDGVVRRVAQHAGVEW